MGGSDLWQEMMVDGCQVPQVNDRMWWMVTRLGQISRSENINEEWGFVAVTFAHNVGYSLKMHFW